MTTTNRATIEQHTAEESLRMAIDAANAMPQRLAVIGPDGRHDRQGQIVAAYFPPGRKADGKQD